MSDYKIDPMLSPADYERAFLEIERSISAKQMLMLRAHYHSGGLAITERELATASGYDDYRSANIQYGSLAKRLAIALDFTPPTRKKTGRPLWTCTLGKGHDRAEFGLEYQWIMHDQVAKALKNLGWV